MSDVISLEAVVCVGLDVAEAGRVAELLTGAHCRPVFVDPAEPEASRRALRDLTTLGVYAASADEAAIADRFAAEDGDGFVVVATGEPERDRIELLSAVARVRAMRADRTARRHAEALIELSELRALFDRSQRAFASLDGYLRTHGLATPERLLSIEPGEDDVCTLASGEHLLQPLPHDAYGLCAITLRLAAPLQEGTRLTAHLFAGDTRIAEWRVEGPRSAGRLCLSLPRGVDEEYREMTLRLAVARGGPAVLQLARERVTARWRPSLVGRPIDFPLAIGLDFAPPTVTVAAPIGSVRATVPTVETGGGVVLPPWREVAYRAIGRDFEWQVKLIGDGLLQAHPVVGRNVIITVEGLDLSPFARVRAQARVAHADGPRVAFALAAVPHDALQAIDPADADLSWATDRSDWLVLGGSEEALVSLELAAAHGGTAHALALVTRCAEENAEYAWACWGTVTLL